MKKLLIALAVITFTSTAFAANNLSKQNNSLQEIDQVVAIVNNGVITQSQVNMAYKSAIKQIKASGQTPPDASTLKNNILNQLIYQKLQLQLAERNHVTVTNAQVNAAIKNIAKQHRISVAMLKQKVQAQGTSYSKYRNEIKKQILISMIQHRALANEIKISDAELNQFLNKFKSQKKFAKQYHIIDILVPLPSAPTSTQAKQAKTQALKIAKSLRNSAKVSTIKGAEVNDLGWRTEMDLPDIFLKQLAKLKSGGIAGPLRAPNGYHVIKLIATKKGKALLPSRDQAKRILMEQKFQKLLHDWVMKLRKQSYVKIVKPQ